MEEHSYDDFMSFAKKCNPSPVLIPATPARRPLVRWRNALGSIDPYMNYFPRPRAYMIIDGFFVIDCDAPEIFELAQKFFPKTLTVQSPSGGGHLYFKAKDFISTRLIQKGLDVLSAGLIMIPPSTQYIVVNDAPVYFLEDPYTLINKFFDTTGFEKHINERSELEGNLAKKSKFKRVITESFRKQAMEEIAEALKTDHRHIVIMNFSRESWKINISEEDCVDLLSIILVNFNKDGKYTLKEIQRCVRDSYAFMEEHKDEMED